MLKNSGLGALFRIIVFFYKYFLRFWFQTFVEGQKKSVFKQGN